VTISVGVAAYTVNGTNADAILKAADDALYRAKTEGRDRVVVADVLVGSAATGVVPPAPAELSDSARVPV